MVSIIECEKQISYLENKINTLERSASESTSSLIVDFRNWKIKCLKEQKAIVTDRLTKRHQTEWEVFNRSGLFLSDDDILMDRYVRALCIKTDFSPCMRSFRKLKNHNYVAFGFESKEHKKVCKTTPLGLKLIGKEVDFWEGIGASTAKNIKITNMEAPRI